MSERISYELREPEAVEAFEAILEGRLEGRLESPLPPDLTRMATLVSALEAPAAAARQARPAPAFRDTLRERLIEQAARRRSPLGRLAASAVLAQQQAARWVAARNAAGARSLRVVMAMSLSLVVLLASGAVLAASHNVTPDHPLYGIKRARESLQLALTPGDEQRGIVLASFARVRLGEIETMLESGGRSAPPYLTALVEMDRATSQARRHLLAAFEQTSRLDPLHRLRDLADVQVLTLSGILNRLPPGARPRAVESINLSDSIRREAGELIRGCPCPTRVPGFHDPEGMLCPCPPLDERPGPGPRRGPAPGPADDSTEPPPPPEDEEEPPDDEEEPPPPDDDRGPLDDILDDLPSDEDLNRIIEDLLGPLPPLPSPPTPIPSLPLPS